MELATLRRLRSNWQATIPKRADARPKRVKELIALFLSACSTRFLVYDALRCLLKGHIMTIDWLALLIAGIFEIIWAVGLKYTEGFTKLLPSLITGSAIVLSCVLLGFAVRTIPIGTGYAVWTGIGASGTLLFGMLFLGESRDPIRIFCICTIIVCILLLKITHK